MVLPLSFFPIVSTGDPDEAQSILSRELVDLRITKVVNPKDFQLQMNTVCLGKSTLSYNRFGADTSIDPGQIEDTIVFAINIGSPVAVYIDGELIASSDQQAPILSPARRVHHHRYAGSSALLVRASYDTIATRFQQTTGRRLRKPIRFAPSIDLSTGVGAQARQLVHFLTQSLAQDKSILNNPLLRTGYDEMLLNLLLALPGSHSDALTADRSGTVLPAVVRKAEQFIEANAAQPITVADLIALTGCSKRSLFRAFQRYRGYTPMQFLSTCRLQTARTRLQNPLPGDTVSSIAHSCGFAHLGRFATAYRQRFAESPSETFHTNKLKVLTYFETRAFRRL